MKNLNSKYLNKKARTIFSSKNLNGQGFTLIEVMVSLSVFAVIMTISMGSILGIFSANRKSESLKTVMDNLNFTMESMAREIRFGKNYHCGASGNITEPLNCPSGTGETAISFLSSDNKQITYSLNGTSIHKAVGSASGALTAPEVTISDLTFYVSGAGTTNTEQPKVLIQVKGWAGTKPESRTDFVLQTLVSQRVLDN